MFKQRKYFNTLLAASALMAAGTVQAADPPGLTEAIQDKCMADIALERAGLTLNCTANDISLAQAMLLQNEDGSDPKCDYPGAEITFDAIYTVTSSATERYDIGLWFSADGDPNGDGALTGECNIATLPTAGAGGFVNVDQNTQPGDTCGDISSRKGANPLNPVIRLTTTCVDPDNNGSLNLPYCTSWRQGGSNQTCTSPLDAYPGAPSKCKCETNFEVAIEVPAAELRVEKTADKASVAEPGAPVTYTVKVYNDGIDPSNAITLTALNDHLVDGSGNVVTSLGSVFQGNKGAAILSSTCTQNASIQAGNSYSCSFTTQVTGNAGDTVTDEVRATGVDDRGNRLSGGDQAAVSITDTRPDITVTKSASVDQVDEPGADVTFTVTVTNTSPAGSQDPIAIQSLVDDVYGNLSGQGSCNSAGNPYPNALGYGSTYTCSFTQFVSGNGKDKTAETNVITATITDDDGGATYSEESNPVTVTIAPVGSEITVSKQVRLGDGNWTDSLDIDEVYLPGTTLSYRVVVTNLSRVDAVSISSLKDKVKLNGGAYGAPVDLATDCTLPFNLAAAGGSKTCNFSLTLAGNADDSHTNEVTAAGLDDDGDSVSASDSAIVRFVDVAPAAALTKTVHEALVTFKLVVRNDSTAEDLHIGSLVDDVYGDVLDANNAAVHATDCTAETVLIGESYECSFQVLVDLADPTLELPQTSTTNLGISDDEGTDVMPMPNDSVTIDFQ
ncbi:MAG: hypothetical protein ACO39S_11115 [Steroidobacteraceae bacterium]